MIFVDFIFVDFDKMLNRFIYLFGIFLRNYFLPTLPSRYGIFETVEEKLKDHNTQVQDVGLEVRDDFKLLDDGGEVPRSQARGWRFDSRL